MEIIFPGVVPSYTFLAIHSARSRAYQRSSEHTVRNLAFVPSVPKRYAFVPSARLYIEKPPKSAVFAQKSTLIFPVCTTGSTRIAYGFYTGLVNPRLYSISPYVPRIPYGIPLAFLALSLILCSPVNTLEPPMKRIEILVPDDLHAQAKATATRLSIPLTTYIRTVLANELRPAPKVASTTGARKGPNTSPAGAVRFFGPMEVGAAGAFRRSRGEEAVAHFAKIKQSLAEYGLSAQANYVYPAWSPAAEDIIDADLLVSDYDVEYPFDTVDDGVAFDLVLQAVEAGAVPESIPAHLIFE